MKRLLQFKCLRGDTRRVQCTLCTINDSKDKSWMSSETHQISPRSENFSLSISPYLSNTHIARVWSTQFWHLHECTTDIVYNRTCWKYLTSNVNCNRGETKTRWKSRIYYDRDNFGPDWTFIRTKCLKILLEMIIN